LLSADQAAVARVDRERQGEDLRKLYVALTRARHAIWVGVAPTDNLHLSAFGYLLATEKIEPTALENHLQALAEGAGSIVVAAAPTPSATHFSPLNGSITLGKALSMPRSVREHWWVASYSALRTTAAAVRREAKIAPDSAQEDVFTEAMQVSEHALRSPTANPKSPAASGLLHALPRGAEVGTFLHDLLEWAADKGFAILQENPEWLRETLTRRCTPRGWQQWIEPLHEWLQQFLNLPFRVGNDASSHADAFSLVGLAEAVAEMEFWLAAEQVNAEEIDKLVCQYTLDAMPRPVLLPNRLNGMLKGFIDLVFAHQGRYYVADYKSNWLGENNEAYSEDAMRAEILHHRYDLQYALYLLALHRLLKSRLPDYDYDEHVGGAVYLFLRGSQAPSQGLHFEKPAKVLIESLDAIFSGQRPQQTLSNQKEVAA
jgi:exodeoxyribonuclease V beta subunit